VRTVDNLVDLYFTSVGRNSKLLLNVPPTRAGLLHETDVARLGGMQQRLSALFEENLALAKTPEWRATGPRAAATVLDLGRTVNVAIADLREDITHGQFVARYTLEGQAGGPWRALCSGSTIGYRKLDRFEPVPVRRVRLRIHDAVDAPRPVEIRLYGSG
jgi:alpha-L-fucosidase